jgi:hypothetical protein
MFNLSNDSKVELLWSLVAVLIAVLTFKVDVNNDVQFYSLLVSAFVYLVAYVTYRLN